MKHNIVKMALMCSAINVFALGVASESAYAGKNGFDVKTFPASMCQPLPHTGTAIIGHSGAVYNWHKTKHLAIVCPVVRDVQSGTTGLEGLKVKRTLRHGYLDFACQLNYFDHIMQNTTTIPLYLQRVTSDNFWFSYSDTPQSISGDLVSYSLTCTIPPRDPITRIMSSIVNITYAEFD